MAAICLLVLTHCGSDEAAGPPGTAGDGGKGEHGTGGAGGTSGQGGDAPAPGGSGGQGGAESCAIWYEQGHGDLYVGYEAATQSLRLSIRGAFGAAEEGLHAPEAVCIRVPRSTYDAIQASGGRPEGSVWDPLGVAADESFWLLPASPVRNVPWFGLSTEGVPSTASFLGDEITLRFAIRTAPAGAHLAQYSVSTLGAPSFSLSTVAGLLTYSRPIAVHEHANWTFSAPGWWVLEVEASAGASDGQRLTSPLALLRFHVEHR